MDSKERAWLLTLPDAIFLSWGERMPLAQGDAAGALVKDALRARREHYLESLARRDWLQALMVVDKGSQLTMIEAWWLEGALTPVDLGACLAAVWSRIEFPHRFGQRRWLRLFKAAGFVTDTPGTEPGTEPLTVYRGAIPTRRRGMSWTLDPVRAAWFARRWDVLSRTGLVYAADVPPRHVLAIFHGREELEVIVNPPGLRNLREMVEREGQVTH